MNIKLKVAFVVLFASFSLGSMNKLEGQELELQSKHHESSLQDTTMANEFFTKGKELSKAAKYDSSIYYCEQAKEIYERLSEQHDLEVIWMGMLRCFNEISWNFILQGKYEVSWQVLTQELKIGIERLTENHIVVAQSYNTIAILYRRKGEYDQALDYFQRSLTIRLRLLGQDHLKVATSYNNIGIVYRRKGDYDKALDYFQRSLTIRLRLLGQDHPQLAYNYNSIGNVYLKKGDYDRALEYYQKDLSINHRLFGENHPDVACGYFNIGGVYFKKGDYDRALEYYQKDLSINHRLFGENHPDVADSYTNIGIVYQYKGEHDRALVYHLKNLTIKLRLLGEGHPDVAVTYNSLGEVFNEKGDYTQAIEYYQRALTIGLKSSGNLHPEVGNYYRGLAKVHFGKNDFDQALTYCQKSFISLVSGFGNTSIYSNPPLGDISNSIYLLNTLALKAKVLNSSSERTGQRDLEMALSTYGLAAELINRMRTGYKAEGSKLTLTENTAKVYDKAVATALKLYKKNQETRYQEMAFAFAEGGKAGTLSQVLQETRAKTFVGIPDSILAIERKLRINLAFYDTQLQEELQKNDGHDSLKIDTYRSRHLALNQEYDHLIATLERDHPKYHALKYQQKTSSVTEIQNFLDENTALLQYFVAPPKLYIFTISKDDFDIHTAPIDSSFAKTVDDFRISIKQSMRGEYIRASRELHGLLIEPVSKNISGKKNLVVIPHGKLYQVPFEALLSKEPSKKVLDMWGNEDSDSQLAYLIKEYNISYHYSATLFQRSKQRKENVNDSFVAFAPVFPDTKDLALNRSLSESLFRSVELGGTTFGELKFSKQEVSEIAALFVKKDMDGFIHLYDKASEQNLKSRTKKYKYVHIATHGFINLSHPKMSGLIMHQSKDSTAMEDGVLYASETYNLELDADLVVLSSCESGVGKLVRAEGVMAITRGFLYSGAANILYSLWKVDDQLTSKFMVDFYQKILAGKKYSEALRTAKLKIIENPQTAAPLLWSSFVLIGE